MKLADAGPLTISERVEVPGLGEVQVHSLRLSEILPAGGDAKNQELRLVALSARDADGEPMGSADEWDAWAGHHLDGWRVLTQAVARVCGLNAEASEGN